MYPDKNLKKLLIVGVKNWFDLLALLFYLYIVPKWIHCNSIQAWDIFKHNTIIRLTNLIPSVDTREAAYLEAIAGAGSLHGIADSCSKGRLLQCSCDSSFTNQQPIKPSPITSGSSGGTAVADANWIWGGCTDDGAFAYRTAKDFVEASTQKAKGIDSKLCNIRTITRQDDWYVCSKIGDCWGLTTVRIPTMLTVGVGYYRQWRNYHRCRWCSCTRVHGN